MTAEQNKAFANQFCTCGVSLDLHDGGDCETAARKAEVIEAFWSIGRRRRG